MTTITDYIDAGWQLCAIPPGEKGPTGTGWNMAGIRDASIVDGQNVGLLHSLSGTAAFDIDDLALTADYLGKDALDALLQAPDAVQIVSGREGRAKLLYALPSFMAMPSKKVTVGGKTAFELRCASAEGKSVQDVLPPSRHPSGSTYQWGGNGNWKQLPPLPPELLAIWQGLLKKDAERNIPMGNSQAPASLDEIRSAVFAISPDCSRQVWIEVGMGLEALGEQSGDPAACFELFDAWSAGSVQGKYSQRVTAQQWRSFEPRADGIGIGTIFFHAQQSGWKRPPPAVPASMFKPVQQEQPLPELKGNIESLFVSGMPYPRLDMSVLPPILSATACMVAANAGSDPMVSVASGLVAVCTVADSRSMLKVKDGLTVPLILRMAPIGTPADTKTGGSKPMFAPVKKIEMEHRSKHDAAMLAWTGKEARHAVEMKAYKEWAASPDAQLPNAVPPTVTPLEPKPMRLRMTSNDVTSAKAIGLLADRPYGMTYILDDGSEWLEALANPNRYDSKTVWLQTDEGGPYEVDRMGSGETYLQNAALSMYLHVHPETLYKLRDKLSGDGTMQRLLPIPLDTSLTTPGGTPAGYSDALKAWEQSLRIIFAIGEKQFEFDAEASALWQSFKVETTELKKKLQACGYSTYLVGFAGKLDGRAARLAFAFHMLTNPHSPVVSAQTLQNAIVFARYCFQCAAFVDGAHMDFDTVDKWISGHVLVLCGQQPTVTLSDLRRSGRRIFDNMPKAVAEDAICSAMGVLADYGWCVVQGEGARSVTWKLNPMVAEVYAERREGLIRARAEMVEKIRGTKK